MTNKIVITLNADRTEGTATGLEFGFSVTYREGCEPFVFIPGNWTGKRAEVTRYTNAIRKALAAK